MKEATNYGSVLVYLQIFTPSLKSDDVWQSLRRTAMKERNKTEDNRLSRLYCMVKAGYKQAQNSSLLPIHSVLQTPFFSLFSPCFIPISVPFSGGFSPPSVRYASLVNRGLALTFGSIQSRTEAHLEQVNYLSSISLS